jgi:hypothetical protein
MTISYRERKGFFTFLLEAISIFKFEEDTKTINCQIQRHEHVTETVAGI